jgi:hypothetical protein
MWQSAWLLVSGALKPPDQAPSPTCPFIKNQQCQRAADSKSGQRRYPRFTPGDRLSEFRGDRSLRGRWKPSAPRRWSPSMRASGFGQRVFAILFHKDVILHKISQLDFAFRRQNPLQTRIRPGITPQNRRFSPIPEHESQAVTLARWRASFAIGACLTIVICSPLTARLPA